MLLFGSLGWSERLLSLEILSARWLSQPNENTPFANSTFMVSIAYRLGYVTVQEDRRIRGDAMPTRLLLLHPQPTADEKRLEQFLRRAIIINPARKTPGFTHGDIRDVPRCQA